MREEQEEYERKARRIKRNKKNMVKKKPIFKKTYKGTRKKYEIRAAMT